MSQRLLAKVVWHGLPMIVFVLIWWPLLHRYYVPGVKVSREMLQFARQTPPEERLQELASDRFLRIEWANQEQLVFAAEKLLRGLAEFPGFPPTALNMPFDQSDIVKGSPEWQLTFAGFAVPETLLNAYEATRREEFLLGAKDVIEGWAAYERVAWLPRGLLWNDHAIAARLPVLTDFWRLYRKHPSYRQEMGEAVLQLVARSGQLLAKPALFTVGTNHGVMQNLGLWHLCLAFPMIPGVEEFKKVALARLSEQMEFYMSDEGVVLEHSAGYQAVGLELIGIGFRYLTMLGEPIPGDWLRKYERAKGVFAQLRRPDGSLPMFGDTDGWADALGPRVARVDVLGRTEGLEYERNWAPRRSSNLYPVSGLALWWSDLGGWRDANNLMQTVVVWSHFPGQSHKYADEMSVLLWAGGQTWWTNVGYWPYGVKGRLDAQSWGGSNAPHLVNEPANSDRNTELLSFGGSDKLSALELERRGPGTYVARRQVVHWKPNLWIVVDQTLGDAASRTTTTWTTSASVVMRKGDIPGSYLLADETGGATLTTVLSGSPGMVVKEYHGSEAPFAGWQVIRGVPRPSSAIVVEQPAKDSWSVAVWAFANEQMATPRMIRQPQRTRWVSSGDWKISLPTWSAMFEIEWRHGRVSVMDDKKRGVKGSLQVHAPSDVGGQIRAIQEAFGRIVKKYPKSADFQRRYKASLFLLLAVGFQGVFFFALRRVSPQSYVLFRVGSVAGWVGVYLWLTMVRWKSWP